MLITSISDTCCGWTLTASDNSLAFNKETMPDMGKWVGVAIKQNERWKIWFSWAMKAEAEGVSRALIDRARAEIELRGIDLATAEIALDIAQ